MEPINISSMVLAITYVQMARLLVIQMLTVLCAQEIVLLALIMRPIACHVLVNIFTKILASQNVQRAISVVLPLIVKIVIVAQILQFVLLHLILLQLLWSKTSNM